MSHKTHTIKQSDNVIRNVFVFYIDNRSNLHFILALDDDEIDPLPFINQSGQKQGKARKPNQVEITF